jgi:(R,R)-butanediol dehydrogenase/meso-butanediol dehydrogenase/diacetyl reductase
MRAAVLHGPHDLRIEGVDERSPRAGEVKIRVAACGICGSDLHLWRGTSAPQPDGPFVIGHEFAGTVVEVGEGVTRVAVDEVVAVRPLIECGSCNACAEGIPSVCTRLRFYGVTPGLAGGMAEYATVTADKVHRLPAGVTPINGALVEPLAVGFHAAMRGLEGGGQSVAIFGGGPIGLAIFLSLRGLGVANVYVVEPSEIRREAIRRAGASVVIDPLGSDVRDEIHGLTNGRGVDVSFDAAGKPRTFLEAQRVAAPHGRVVVVAGYEEPVQFDPSLVVSTEITITGAFAYTPDDFESAIRLVEQLGSSADAWVTRIALGDIVDQGFQAVAKQSVVKVLVVP